MSCWQSWDQRWSTRIICRDLPLHCSREQPSDCRCWLLHVATWCRISVCNCYHALRGLHLARSLGFFDTWHTGQWRSRKRCRRVDRGLHLPTWCRVAHVLAFLHSCHTGQWRSRKRSRCNALRGLHLPTWSCRMAHALGFHSCRNRVILLPESQFSFWFLLNARNDCGCFRGRRWQFGILVTFGWCHRHLRYRLQRGRRTLY